MIKDVKPICTVEREGFSHLINSIAPQFVPYKRTYFTEKLEETFYRIRGKLTETLERADEVGVTIDLWSKHNKA